MRAEHRRGVHRDEPHADPRNVGYGVELVAVMAWIECRFTPCRSGVIRVRWAEEGNGDYLRGSGRGGESLWSWSTIRFKFECILEIE